MIFNLQDMDQAIADQVAQEAQRHQVNLNDFILKLLQLGLATWKQTEQHPIYHDLDDLAGTWTAEDAALFEAASADFEQIDESLWA
jgi:hypothetical protein